jgi:hypothetical protein
MAGNVCTNLKKVEVRKHAILRKIYRIFTFFRAVSWADQWAWPIACLRSKYFVNSMITLQKDPTCPKLSAPISGVGFGNRNIRVTMAGGCSVQLQQKRRDAKLPALQPHDHIHPRRQPQPRIPYTYTMTHNNHDTTSRCLQMPQLLLNSQSQVTCMLSRRRSSSPRPSRVPVSVSTPQPKVHPWRTRAGR